MSIILFQRRFKRNLNQKRKILFVNSGEEAPINVEYIREVFEKYGYKRSEDPLIKGIKELLDSYH